MGIPSTTTATTTTNGTTGSNTREMDASSSSNLNKSYKRTSDSTASLTCHNDSSHSFRMPIPMEDESKGSSILLGLEDSLVSLDMAAEVGSYWNAKYI